MRTSWIQLCALTSSLAIIDSVAADDGGSAIINLPPGEPIAQVTSGTNMLAAQSGSVTSHSGVMTTNTTDSVAQPRVPGAYVSPWLRDTVKLAQAGIEQGVILNFVDSAGTFNLTAEQIIFLRDLGFNNELITTMIQHDAEIAAGLRQASAASSDSQPTIHLTFVHNSSVPLKAPEPVATGVVPPPQSQSITLEASEGSLATAVEKPNGNSQDRPRGLIKQTQPLPTHAVVSPVRQPYAVQITDPILVLPENGREPNLIVIHLLP